MIYRRTKMRRKAQQGSALLIVLVFAAILAITLYTELPVVAFEARRQKEEMLIERGGEYVRAVQLYYRRNRGAFPPSIEALENTNNIRYLRARYKDPFTGQDNWRLLHAGPGGALLDSKVSSPLQPPGMPGAGQNGPNQQTPSQSAFGQSTSTFGQTNSTFGQTNSAFGQSNSAFGQNSSGFGSRNNDDSEVTTVPALPAARPPAVEAGGGSGSSNPSQTDVEAQLQVLASGDNYASTSAGAARTSSALTAAQPNTAANTNVMQMMSPVLNSPTGSPQAQNPQGLGAASSFGSPGAGSMGQIGGGAGIAGVASKAKGKTIKLVHDEDDFSKWEFYYDPTQDTTMRATLPTGMPGPAGQVGAPGVNPAPNQQQSSIFGNNNNNNNQSNSTPATDNNGQQQTAPLSAPQPASPGLLQAPQPPQTVQPQTGQPQ